jgi:hypothetical protein
MPLFRWPTEGKGLAIRTETFINFLEFAIFAEADMQHYSKSADDDLKILRNNLGAFLYHRSMRLNEAPSDFPEFVRHITEHLTQDCAHDKERIEVYGRILSKILARNYGSEFDHLILPGVIMNFTKRLKAGNQRVDRPLSVTSGPTLSAAAAAIGSLEALKDAAAKDRLDLWACSDTLGYPIEAAALNGHNHVVKALIRQAVKDSKVLNAILSLRPTAVARSIAAAITGHHFSLTQ